MTASETSGRAARDIATVGGLYLAQGIVWGAGGLVVLPRLAAAGVSLDAQAGIFALSSVPWVLKLAWGPVLDLPIVRRIPPAFVAATATVAVAAALAWLATVVDPTQSVARVTWIWLLLNVALGLQDVATDAFAIDRIAARLRGAATAVMLAGHHVGAELLAGAWVGAWVAARGLAGLGDLAWVCVAIAGLVVALALVDREPSRARPPRGRVADAVADLVRSGAGIRVLGLAMVVFAADVATSAVSGQWLVDLGWSPEEIAARIVWPLLGGTLGGQAVAALVVDRVARPRVVAASSAALGACWIGFALLAAAWHVVAFVQVFVVVQAAITAVLYVAVHAALMDATAPALRATQFAVLTASLNLPRVWAPFVATLLVGRVGFAAMFAVCGAFQIAVAVAARWAVAATPAGRSRPS